MNAALLFLALTACVSADGPELGPAQGATATATPAEVDPQPENRPLGVPMQSYPPYYVPHTYGGAYRSADAYLQAEWERQAAVARQTQIEMSYPTYGYYGSSPRRNDAYRGYGPYNSYNPSSAGPGSSIAVPGWGVYPSTGMAGRWAYGSRGRPTADASSYSAQMRGYGAVRYPQDRTGGENVALPRGYASSSPYGNSGTGNVRPAPVSATPTGRQQPISQELPSTTNPAPVAASDLETVPTPPPAPRVLRKF